MELFRFVLLALIATYLLGLLFTAIGLGRLPEPARYHLTALAILLSLWLFGATFGFQDQAGRPDLVKSLIGFAPFVLLWWLHQLRSHRRAPRPKQLDSKEKRPA